MDVGLESVPDRGPGLIFILWSLTSLACLTATLRVVARTRNRLFGWDDAFIVFSTICFLGWSIVLTLYAKHGGLEHIDDVEKSGPDNVATVLFLKWLSQVFGIMGVAAGKISVAALLLAIISLTELRWQRIFLWIVPISLAGIIAVACSILTFAQCSPAKALWDTRVPGDCMKPQVMSSFGTFTGGKLVSNSAASRTERSALELMSCSSAFNTFTDASLAIVPATIFWQLKHSTAEKMQLTIVFGLNILTSICSSIQTQYLAELANRTDQTWAIYGVFAWATGELFLMIVCGTIPTLHIVLGWFRVAAGSIRGAASTTLTTMRESRKGGSRLKSELERENEHGLDELRYMKFMTRTTVESINISRSASSDPLDGEKTLPENAVRVETMFDVRRDTRPNTAASAERP